jgi:inner membrane protein import complex subunit Tim44-like protein
VKLAAIVAVVVVCATTPAFARPGGGSSFGGGSSGGSSGGSRSSGGSSWRPSSGGGHSTSPSSPPKPSVFVHRAPDDATRRASWVPGQPSLHGTAPPRPEAWPPPNELSAAGIGAVLLVLGAFGMAFAGAVVFVVSRLARRRQGNGWSTAATRAVRRTDLEAIRATDPDFSVALFEDFLYALYAEAHTARGAGTLERLGPWLKPTVRAALVARGQAPVSAVVIGAQRLLAFDTSNPALHRVLVELEANYAETPAPGGERAYWVTERWWLSRARTAKSRPPARARILDCPGCGAALDKVLGGACGYCQRAVDGGDLDWVVESIELVAIEPRGPMLTGTTEERGTDLPTVVDAALGDRMAELSSRDPDFAPPAFMSRVGLVFATMQTAWSSLEWERARPFLSDNLYEAQRYWIQAYRRAGLRNVTERARIQRIDPVRVASDRWYDSVTVRLWASGLDYTLRDLDGAVVGGSRTRERSYSEYWTFIRGRGAKGPTRTEPVCPQCGAPLAVTMAGSCTHCKAKVTSGEFDWVLARIEQDEAYSG